MNIKSSKNSAKLRGLYAITDTPLMGGRLLTDVEQALQGGVGIVQYRDKSTDQQQRTTEATALLQLCRQYQALLLINDDIELAARVQAPAIHIGQTDGKVAEARSRLGADAIIGVTCHDSLELARQAAAEGADYVAFGAFFRSSTKPEAIPAPLSLLQQARAELQLPIVAIGGITLDNASEVIAAGADMVAVMHNLFAAESISDRAQAFNRLFAETTRQ